jgi:chemotaxis protein MotC
MIARAVAAAFLSLVLLATGLRVAVASEDGGHGGGEHAEPKEEHGAAKEEGDANKGEAEEASEAEPPPPPLWPETPAVELSKQPYVLLRSLRAVQDKVAVGDLAAHEEQRRLLQTYGEDMRSLPVGVWDDVRNVRAAIFFVLSGGNPAVIKTVLGRPRTPFIERRLLKGALAYGEGRLVDALSMVHKIDARKLDPLLAGMVALIQGTLVSKKDGVKAVSYFDDARLLAPGTLIEESALRQQILLVAREGELERFDTLTDQYSRRFPNSLFARNFRRQFFGGVARQNFKRGNEWLTRTEAELLKVPASERVGLYLSIAEEATKAGNIGIARFAAEKAREMSAIGSSSMQRAKLFEGASLVATEDFEKGVNLLGEIDTARLRTSDREVYDAAMTVARSVGKWPEATHAVDDAPLESLGRAQTLLSKVDSLLGGAPQ